MKQEKAGVREGLVRQKHPYFLRRDSILMKQEKAGVRDGLVRQKHPYFLRRDPILMKQEKAGVRDGFFESPECYEPVVSDCKSELVYTTRAFRSRQRYICGDRRDRKGANKMSMCVHQVKRHFRKCRQKRQQRLDEISQVAVSPSPLHPWC
ncbi:hypothetical protein ElyMa_001067900, partial [Elysia marginata]